MSVEPRLGMKWEIEDGEIVGSEPLALPRVFTSEVFGKMARNIEEIGEFPPQFSRVGPNIGKRKQIFETKLYGPRDQPRTDASDFRNWLNGEPDLRAKRVELKTLESGKILDTVKLRDVQMLAGVSIVVNDAVESIGDEGEALEFIKVIKSLGPMHRVMNPLEKKTKLPTIKTRGIGIIFANDNGCLKAFYGITGVRIEEITDAVFLNLVEMARGRRCGLLVWSESAFAKLDGMIDDLRKSYDAVATKYGIWPKGNVTLVPIRRGLPSFLAWEKGRDWSAPKDPNGKTVPGMLCDGTLVRWEKRLYHNGV
jgi:hypothetical protein